MRSIVGVLFIIALIHGAFAGTIILGGDDYTEHHIAGGQGFINKAVKLCATTSAFSETNDEVVVLGANETAASRTRIVYEAACTAGGLTCRFLKGGPAIEAFLEGVSLQHEQPSVIVFSGNEEGGAVLTTEENAVIDGNSDVISDFADAGGSIISHSGLYGWLPSTAGLTRVGTCLDDYPTVTELGSLLFPGLQTTDVNAPGMYPCHNKFTIAQPSIFHPVVVSSPDNIIVMTMGSFSPVPMVRLACTGTATSTQYWRFRLNSSSWWWFQVVPQTSGKDFELLLANELTNHLGHLRCVSQRTDVFQLNCPRVLPLGDATMTVSGVEAPFAGFSFDGITCSDAPCPTCEGEPSNPVCNQFGQVYASRCDYHRARCLFPNQELRHEPCPGEPWTPIPTRSPTSEPTAAPTSTPTSVPTHMPTHAPTSVPTLVPTAIPTSVPTSAPTALPTGIPTPVPTDMPTPDPTSVPTPIPTSMPTPTPTNMPTPIPTAMPTPEPTNVPTPRPTSMPTPIPTALPTPVPTRVPTPMPTGMPTPMPTSVPTPMPTSVPTPMPTGIPTPAPTSLPTPMPTSLPTPVPTGAPTPMPTDMPSPSPTNAPTPQPTAGPTPSPTDVPTPSPTYLPSPSPTALPTPTSTALPTPEPTRSPTPVPTHMPSPSPTALPTLSPTPIPTAHPTPPPSPSPVTEVALVLPRLAIPNKHLTIGTKKEAHHPDPLPNGVDQELLSLPQGEGSHRSQDSRLLQAENYNPTVTYEWHSNTIDLGDPDVLLTDRDVPDIVINGSAIKDNAGQIHIRLTYTVEDQEFQADPMDRFIPVNRAPYGGECSSDSLRGEAQVETFTLSCSGWQDDENSALRYRFSQEVEGKAFPKRLGVFSESPQLEVSLPQGEIQLLAEIQDKRGGIAEYIFPDVIDVYQFELVDIINGVFKTPKPTSAPTPTPTQTVPTPSIDVGNGTDETTAVATPTPVPTGAPTPAPTIAYNPLLARYTNNSLSEAIESSHEAAEANATAEEAFVQAYNKIDSVSEVLNAINETAPTVSVEQLTDLRNDVFQALTTVLDPLVNNNDAGNVNESEPTPAPALTEEVVTMSLQLMVDLSEPESQLSTNLRNQMIDTASELLFVESTPAAPVADGDDDEDATDDGEAAPASSESVLNTASLVISLIGELSEAEHTEDAVEQHEFADKVSTTVSQVADGISATLLPTQRAVEVDTPKLGLYVKVETADTYQKNHYFRGFNATFPADLFADSCATTVGLSVVVSNNSFHPIDNNNTNAANASANTRETFEEYADAVASMKSISQTVRVEFFERTGNCSETVDADGNILLDDESVKKVNTELPVHDLDPCEPILLHIPITEEFLNLNFSRYTPVCRHRDEDSGRAVSNCVPDEENLEQLQRGQATHLVCRCNHLTFFDAGWADFIPNFNTLTEDDVRDFTFENIRAHPTGAYVTGGLFACFLLLFVWGVYLDSYTFARNKEDIDDQQKRIAFFRDSDILTHVITRKLESENKVARLAYGVWLHCIRNYHRWTAIFWRDRHSSFLSKDRAVVIYAFLMSTLAISAIFYGQQTDQSFLLMALISAVAAGVPAFFFKWLFCRCRISDDQQDVNEFNLDQALKNTKGLTFVNALDVLESDRLHGFGRFAFTQRAITRVRTRRHQRTKSGNLVLEEGEEKGERSPHRRGPRTAGVLDGSEGEDGHRRLPRSRRDSEVSTLSEDLSDDGAVFGYLWDVGVPLGAAFDNYEPSSDEESSDGEDEEKEASVEYASDSDDDSGAENEEKEREKEEKGEKEEKEDDAQEQKDGQREVLQEVPKCEQNPLNVRIPHSQKASGSSPDLHSDVDSLPEISLSAAAYKRPGDGKETKDFEVEDDAKTQPSASNELSATSVDSLPEVSVTKKIPQSPYTSSEEQASKSPNSVESRSQTARMSRLQNMKSTLRIARTSSTARISRLIHPRISRVDSVYEGLTPTPATKRHRRAHSISGPSSQYKANAVARSGGKLMHKRSRSHSSEAPAKAKRSAKKAHADAQEPTQTVQVSRLQSMKSTLRFGRTSTARVNRLMRTRTSRIESVYDGLTPTPATKQRRRAHSISGPSSQHKANAAVRKGKKKKHRRTRSHSTEAPMKAKRKAKKSQAAAAATGQQERAHTVHHKRANSSIRALQRTLTQSRHASREQLARVLRPPREAKSESGTGREQSRSQTLTRLRLQDDTRFRALMLPMVELADVEPQSTLTSTKHTRSNTLTVPGAVPSPIVGTGSLTVAELAMEGPGAYPKPAMKKSSSRAQVVPAEAQTKPASTLNTTFKLRSTGKPLPWLMEQLRGMEIKDAIDDCQEKEEEEEKKEEADEDSGDIAIIPEATQSVAAARSAFENRRPSISISRRAAMFLENDEPSFSASRMSYSASKDMMHTVRFKHAVTEEKVSGDSKMPSALGSAAMFPAVEASKSAAMPSAFEIEDPTARSGGNQTALSEITLVLDSDSSTPAKKKSRRRGWGLAKSKEKDNAAERPRNLFGLPKFLRGRATLPRRHGATVDRRGGRQLEDGGSARRRTSRGTWPPWVRWLVFCLAILWALGCTVVVLLFSLQFDLKSEEHSYYEEFTCHDAAAAESDQATTSTNWMSSIATSAALDIFAIQPVLLLGFAGVKIAWQSRQRRRTVTLKKQFSSLGVS